MSTAKKAKVKSSSDVSLDRLSCLPPEMKGNILSRLSVQEAVRTSILSSVWRNAWTTMPKIILRKGSFAKSKFITLVDMALSLHQGHLDTFEISGNKIYHGVFDRWMLKLSMVSPSSITIKLISGPKYNIPSSLFSICYLSYLCLENCIIRLPRLFQGFKRLTALNLRRFSLTDSDIESLISCCPVLSVLKLEYFEGISCINIRAFQLKFLVVSGKFDDIHLNAPDLLEIIIVKDEVGQPILGPQDAHDGKSYLKQALGSLSNIRTLTMHNDFLTYLSEDYGITEFPVMFDRLEKITVFPVMFDLHICYPVRSEIWTACSLFQNAPNLKILMLTCVSWDEEGFAPTGDQYQHSRA